MFYLGRIAFFGSIPGRIAFFWSMRKLSPLNSGWMIPIFYAYKTKKKPAVTPRDFTNYFSSFTLNVRFNLRHITVFYD